jgi:hypothetical protein
MSLRAKTPARIAGLCACACLVAACGTEGISVPKSSPYYHGAVLFHERCAGCHTLSVAGTEGSPTSVADRLRNQGPNFNLRKETVQTVLYAIRNGGFSGQIMPQNVVVGKEAEEVARFLAHYAGDQIPYVPSVEISLPGETKTTTTTSALAAAARGAASGGTPAPSMPAKSSATTATAKPHK